MLPAATGNSFTMCFIIANAAYQPADNHLQYQLLFATNDYFNYQLIDWSINCKKITKQANHTLPKPKVTSSNCNDQFKTQRYSVSLSYMTKTSCKSSYLGSWNQRMIDIFLDFFNSSMNLVKQIRIGLF